MQVPALLDAQPCRTSVVTPRAGNARGCRCHAAIETVTIDKKPPYWIGKTGAVSQAINLAINNPTLWGFMRAGARKTMIKTAESSGIPWRQAVEELRNTPELEDFKSQIEDTTLQYPDYYHEKFHAYDGGNLDWEATWEFEVAAATTAMRIFKDDKITSDAASHALRRSFLDATEDYCEQQGVAVKSAVDVACAAGLSTRSLADRFPGAKVQGLDLSPHFLALAELRCRQAEAASPAASTSYLHANAEAMPLDDRSQDMVAASYLVHEMPVHGTKGFLRDAHRVLRPGGVIAIVDGDPW
ncbi:TPA: hypothetical protein ACH3X3_002600 [Trebouxia sp. C0006]